MEERSSESLLGQAMAKTTKKPMSHRKRGKEVWPFSV
jgi:hypothetical protein